jgi:hypothetical protein
MTYCHLIKKSAVMSFSVATLCVVGGCGKKGAQAPPATPAAEQPSSPAATDAAGSGNTPLAAVAPSQSQASYQQVQAAMKSRDYQQAVAAMVAYQRTVKPTTPEQSVRYVQQMRDFQMGLASAAASGDPNAKAAVAALRASAAHQ